MKNTMSDPYVIKCENTSTDTKRCVLFGWNRYWNKPNFGSDEGVIISNVLNTDGIDYSYILAESANINYRIGVFRLSSQEQKKLQKLVAITHTRGNGKIVKAPIWCDVEIYQFQNNVVDIHSKFTLDAGSEMQFDLNANEILYVSVYPRDKAKLSDHLTDEIQEEAQDKAYRDSQIESLTSQGTSSSEVSDFLYSGDQDHKPLNWFQRVLSNFNFWLWKHFSHHPFAAKGVNLEPEGDLKDPKEPMHEDGPPVTDSEFSKSNHPIAESETTPTTQLTNGGSGVCTDNSNTTATQ